MADHTLFTGDDGETAYLLRIWDSGEHELAVRSVAGGTRETWSPPVALTPVPAEFALRGAPGP